MDPTAAVESINYIQSALSVLGTLQLTLYLFPPQADVKDGACFDYIIIGAGTAGSVIASRLTENKTINVLLIEAGDDPPMEAVSPATFLYLKKSKYDWNYTTEDDGYTQQFHTNHETGLTRGKMLGGSSSINFMVYTRGNYHDFDTWANITGDNSWSWENVLPYFIKSEDMTDPDILQSSDAVYHGTGGYLKVKRYEKPEFTEYFDAFQEAGHEKVLDVNGKTPCGITKAMFNIGDGFRQSSCISFLRPAKDRPNLFVLKNTLVTKILFDDYKNATGVEVSLENNSTMSFKAHKEIIISAGTINTPQLLMLSGIGPKEHLENHDIEVISDLPVGQTLQDHVTVAVLHTMGNSTPSEPTNPGEFPNPQILGYAALNKSQKYPDYEFISFVLNDPSTINNFCYFFYQYSYELCTELYNGSIGKSILYSFIVLLNPKSSGKILLRSKDPKEKPLIYNGYYSDNEDLENHAKYLSDFYKVHNTTYFREVQAEFVVPKVCGCGDSNNPTHEFWKCYSLCNMASAYHYAASCLMGLVVEPNLKVKGVQRLRIADSSVMPKVVSAHPNAATLMIGERAADIIKKEHNHA